MKITKGDITIEVESGDDPHKAVALINALSDKDKGRRDGGPDCSLLTPRQREVYDELSRHPDGAHYAAVAEAVGLRIGVVNSRLNDMAKNHPNLLCRIGSGKFKAVV